MRYATHNGRRPMRHTRRDAARRNARIAAFIGNGAALLGTIALIAALTALAGVLAVERNAPTYALVVTDNAGDAWVVDYALSYADCREARASYALGVATCDAAKG